MSFLLVKIEYIDIADPCENPPTTIRDDMIPELISSSIILCIAALDALIPSSSSGIVNAVATSKVFMSNHAGIGAPEIDNIFNDWDF